LEGVRRLSIYWSNIARNIQPYIPGEQPKDRQYIKLNTNENPYPPSERVIQAMKKAANENLRLYPDPECYELREVLANHFNLGIDNVYIGNGSDELLAFSFMAFFNPDKPILFPDITYTFYPVYANLFNIKYQTIRLDEEFSIPVDHFSSSLTGGQKFQDIYS
jgi:histidinol-phosphate aminotransferase